MIQHLKQNVITIASLALALPTAYLIGASMLKFEMNVDVPYDTIAPFLERTGISKSLGSNINLLILSGPVAAFGLSLFRVLRIRFQFTQNHFLFQFILKKRWLPLLVAAFCASLLGILFMYLMRENCV